MQASSDRITTSTNGGPDSFDDMGWAASLASMGAIVVAKTQQGQPVGRAPAPKAQQPPPVRTLPGASEMLIR